MTSRVSSTDELTPHAGVSCPGRTEKRESRMRRNSWARSAWVNIELAESVADLALYLGWSRGLRHGF